MPTQRLYCDQHENFQAFPSLHGHDRAVLPSSSSSLLATPRHPELPGEPLQIQGAASSAAAAPQPGDRTPTGDVELCYAASSTKSVTNLLSPVKIR